MEIVKTKIHGIPTHECFIDMYDQFFYLVFGKNNLKKLAGHIDVEFDRTITARGAVIVSENPYCIYLWFPDKNYERVKEGTLAHEIVHLMDFISINKGIKHDVNNQEIYAQFMGYLFTNLLPFFKSK